LHALKYARKVLAVEPHPGNFQELRRNCGGYINCELLQAAAVPGGNATAQLWLSTTGTFTHSLIPRGRRVAIGVQAVKFADLLRGITELKCDVEGAEYVLEPWKRCSTLRGLAVDFHRWCSSWRIRMADACDQLAAAGFKPLVLPRLCNQHTLAGVWVR
jgi:FkbM family methyltransferase